MNQNAWSHKIQYDPPRLDHARSIPIRYAGSPSSLYNVIDDNRTHSNYEEPEESEYYEKLPDVVHMPQFQQPSSSTTKSSLASPPPIICRSALQRFYYPNDGHSNFSCCSRSLKFTACVIFITTIIIALISAFLWHINVKDPNIDLNEEAIDTRQLYGLQQPLQFGHQHNSTNKSGSNPLELLITANYLATLMVTRRKICIFEVSTNEAEESRRDFEREHIQEARLLFFSNLSHSGVPVHPLQFQRYVRNLGVDSDCRIVLYDKGQQIWAAYAFWIFRLFGHEKISLLNGGFLEWKIKAKDQANLYRISQGLEDSVARLGNYRAGWVNTFILTFDDVIANFEAHKYSIIDAQSEHEYEGNAEGAVFGHIRGAVNVPIDYIYDWHNNTWPTTHEHLLLLNKKGLSINKPVLIYDGTSLRSSLIWIALQRLNIESAIYFGSWPEFVIRAPDQLKVIPKDVATI